MPMAAVPLAAGGSHDYNTGVQWTELSNADLGATGTVTWTVSCGELPAAASLPANTWVAASTNAQNVANGWATVSAVPGSGSVSLTLTQPRNFYACFEWRTDGNVPEQRLQADQVTVGPPFVDHFLKSQGINDGLYKFVCLKASQTTVVVPVLHYVEVRMAFGAESDERFDWTRFDALP